MDDLGRADGRQIPIALIGEHDAVGDHALDARGNRRGAAMRGLDHVAGHIIIHKHRAAHRAYADGVGDDVQFLDHLADHPMDDAVQASGAIGELVIRKTLGPFKDFLHQRASISSDG